VKIKEAKGRDNSSFKLPPPKKVGGSATNLSHSLKGTSANQKGK
jgi:hypothetical protein